MKSILVYLTTTSIIFACSLASYGAPTVHDTTTCAGGVCCISDTATSTVQQNEPLVCTLGSEEKIARRAEIRSLLTKAATQAEETKSGYTITFGSKYAGDVLEFIELERECCTFFNFNLEFPSKKGPIKLSITGPPGAKDFLKGMIEEMGTLDK